MLHQTLDSYSTVKEISHFYRPPNECKAIAYHQSRKPSQPKLYVKQVLCNKSENWCIHDLKPKVEIPIVIKRRSCSWVQSDDDLSLNSKDGSTSDLQDHSISNGLLRNSIIWAPPMNNNTMALLQNKLFQSSSTSDSSSNYYNYGMLVNYNASIQVGGSARGGMFRTRSHPDFDQSSSHWLDIYLDFKLGQENRMHMKIRRDIPLKLCTPVIALRLNNPGACSEDRIQLFWPDPDSLVDLLKSANDLGMGESAVIHVGFDQ